MDDYQRCQEVAAAHQLGCHGVLALQRTDSARLWPCSGAHLAPGASSGAEAGHLDAGCPPTLVFPTSHVAS